MILAISGSLRRGSINSAALRAAARAAARSGIRVAVDDSVRGLPHFDPDLEDDPPGAVRRFRVACAEADALLLAVPEYTFGIPGAFKNALDWTVRTGSLYGKPVAVLHVAPPGRGGRAREAMGWVLKAHGAEVEHHVLPIGPSELDELGEIGDSQILERLGSIATELACRARTIGAA